MERRQERKVVTVLFCDLVGFTSRAEELDPEDVAALLAPYHARLKEELERYGGTVEKFIGDAVMALFGAPVAHEDDPERAVRAALAIREYAAAEAIELRIGIATGEALVTLGARPDQGETMATGDVVNTTARLQSAAPVNGILVGEKTFEATKDAIDYREHEPVEAKGKAQPIPVREALRARSRIALDRLHATPLVGRERELDLLVDALTRARAERQPQLVTLVGVPGIGKSRLVYELSQAADRDPELISWRQGRCLPYGDGVTFWALGEIVKAQLGVLETDSVEDAEGKLREAVSDDWVQASLRPLLGLDVHGPGETGRREESFTAWRRFLEGLADERPLVLVFEDLHWADEDLLEFVDHLVDWASGVPLLVVCTARPELLERRRGWGGGKTNALTISLSPLSDDQTARLLGGILEQAVMPAETQAPLLARAGGNPLYAEQYARMLVERAGADLPLPETVQGIVAARLDVLERDEKALLQDASVIGKTFWLGALSSLSQTERGAVEASLHVLERRGLLRRERETTVEGDTEYAFLHVLMREVAYGQIPRASRAEKHRLAAEWIESLGRQDHAEMLAYHYREALALARAAGLETSALEPPARRALRDAGDRALALHASAAALRFYEAALELWPEAEPGHASLLFARARAHFLAVEGPRTNLFAEAAEALLADGDREAAAEAVVWEALELIKVGAQYHAFERASAAAALLEGTAPSPAKAWVDANHARMLVLVDRRNEALEVARAARAVADELGLADVQANALQTIGMARVYDDDFGGLDDLEESLRIALELGSPFEIARTYNNLGVMCWLAGQTARATEVIEARAENEERYGIPGRWGQAFLAVNRYWRGQWDEAMRKADDYLADEASVYLPNVATHRARMRLARDDLVGAAADWARVGPAPGDQMVLEDSLLVSVQLALAEGRHADAAARLDELLALVGGASKLHGGRTVEAALVAVELDRAGDAFVEAARSRPRAPWHQVAAAVAGRDFEAAADRLAELLVPPLEARTRLIAAQRLLSEGRRAEADAQLEKALAFWRSVGATRFIREGEALLAATA